MGCLGAALLLAMSRVIAIAVIIVSVSVDLVVTIVMLLVTVNCFHCDRHCHCCYCHHCHVFLIVTHAACRGNFAIVFVNVNVQRQSDILIS